MFRLGSWLKLCSLVAICVLIATGCGDGDAGDEVVYLHVFNAYPGAASMGLMGPTGPVVQDLPFGERTDEPVAIDRNFGSDFAIFFADAPNLVDVQLELFGLYPGETATLMISRRTEEGADAQLFRHVRSTSPYCRAVFDNSLALDNDDGLGQFDYIVGWHMPELPVHLGGFDEEFEQQQLQQLDMTEYQRPTELFAHVDSHPYYALTELDIEGEEAGYFAFAWLGVDEEIDAPAVDFSTGAFHSPPTSIEFVSCIEEAADQEEDAGGDDGMFDFDQDETEAEDCDDLERYNTELVQAGVPEFYMVHYDPAVMGNTPPDCSAEFRIYSDFANIFQGEHGFDPNENQRIGHTPEFTVSDHFFFSLYGFPYDPLRETWLASDSNPESEHVGDGGGFVEDHVYPSDPR